MRLSLPNLRFLLWLFCLALPLLGLSELAWAQEPASPPLDPDYTDGGGPIFFGIFALVIVLIIFAVMLVLIGIGIVLGILAVIAGCVLVAVGAVSTSVLYGFITKSPAGGFRALFLQIGMVVGLPCGIAMAYLAAWVSTQWSVSGGDLWLPLVGGICGVGAGLLVALIFNVAWGLAAKQASRRLADFRKKRALARVTASAPPESEALPGPV